jgi:glycine/D-amino acid oxidase-like deaminating enzyme
MWQRHSLRQWVDLDPTLFVPTGVLWFAGRDDGFEGDSEATLRALGVATERLDPDDLSRRWPQIAPDGFTWALHEPDAGVLMARRGVATAARAFTQAGGDVRIGRAQLSGAEILVNDDRVKADAVVFAAGPWLPKLLGAVPGLELSVPQQEIIYFATPPGDDRFDAARHPTWVDYDGAFYGIPSIEGRGFKIAPDWPGPLVDPDRQERRLSDERVDVARAYLRRRFPAMASQPVAEGRVCQYELTADTHFIIDRHPTLDGAWILGGGSGHGYKHGPAIGEYLSALILGDKDGAASLAPPDDRFALRPRASALGMRTAGVAPGPA